MSVTKKDLSAFLRKELDLSAEVSDSLIDHFFLTIKTTLRSKENIKLAGFGTFEAFNTKKRVGRNPKTMESFLIPSKKKVRFSSTAKAKNFLN